MPAIETKKKLCSDIPSDQCYLWLSFPRLESSSSATASLSRSAESLPRPRGRQLQQQVPIPAQTPSQLCFCSDSRSSSSDWWARINCPDGEWLILDNVYHHTPLTLQLLMYSFTAGFPRLNAAGPNKAWWKTSREQHKRPLKQAHRLCCDFIVFIQSAALTSHSIWRP